MSRKTELLSAEETFEHYECRTRPVSVATTFPAENNYSAQDRLSPLSAAEMGRPFRYPDMKRTEIGRSTGTVHYAPTPPGGRFNGSNHSSRDSTTGVGEVRTAYWPQRNQRHIPLGAIVCVSIGVPVFIIICLFGAVQLQELGIL